MFFSNSKFYFTEARTQLNVLRKNKFSTPFFRFKKLKWTKTENQCILILKFMSLNSGFINGFRQFWFEILFQMIGLFNLEALSTQMSRPIRRKLCIFIHQNSLKFLLQARDGECTIWGRKAKFVPVQYIAHNGKKRKSKLLIR